MNQRVEERAGLLISRCSALELADVAMPGSNTTVTQ